MHKHTHTVTHPLAHHEFSFRLGRETTFAMRVKFDFDFTILLQKENCTYLWVTVCVFLIALHFRLIWSSKLAVRQLHLTKSTCTLYQFRFYVVYVVCGKGFAAFFLYFLRLLLLLCAIFFPLVSKRRFNMLSYVASVMQIWITYMLCIMKSPVVGCFCHCDMLVRHTHGAVNER